MLEKHWIIASSPLYNHTELPVFQRQLFVFKSVQCMSSSLSLLNVFWTSPITSLCSVSYIAHTKQKTRSFFMVIQYPNVCIYILLVLISIGRGKQLQINVKQPYKLWLVHQKNCNNTYGNHIISKHLLPSTPLTPLPLPFPFPLPPLLLTRLQ